MGGGGCRRGIARVCFAVDHRNPRYAVHHRAPSIQRNEEDAHRHLQSDTFGQTSVSHRGRLGHAGRFRWPTDQSQLRTERSRADLWAVALSVGSTPENRCRVGQISLTASSRPQDIPTNAARTKGR